MENSGFGESGNSAPARPCDGILCRFGVFVVWALPLLIGHLYLKYTLLTYGGLVIVSRAMSLNELSSWAYLGFYARDILESLVLIPVALFALAAAVPQKFRSALLFVVVQFGLFAAMACWAAYLSIGRYPSPELIIDFVRAYRVDRATVDPLTIFSTVQLMKMVGILSLIVIPFGLIRASQWRSFWQRKIVWLFGIYIILAGGAVALALDGTTTSYHRGHLERLAREATANDALRFEDGSQYSRSELSELYNRVVFPDGRADGTLEAPAIGVPGGPRPNVIVVILETASARDYLFSREHMPEVANLLDHSILARRHLSVYPYSIRANFSIFSSVYDLDSKKMMAEVLKGEKPRLMDALPLVLRDRGYVTRYYYPNQLIDQDEAWMWPYLGFSEVIEGDAFDSAAEKIETPHPKVARDQALFDRVVNDIEHLQSDGKPFMFAVVTSLGHAPYPDLRSAAQRAATPVAERAELVDGMRKFVDGQIGRLVDSLRRSGALENTILVITGDHGVRSMPDDPRLDLRVLNEASFHVPLIVHYPRAIERATSVDYVTSHIDIAPTILELAGISTEGLFLQGLPISDSRTADRVTFVLGGHYHGSNGLHYRGRYFMQNEISELMYINDEFDFGLDDLVTPARPELTEEAGRYRDILHQLRRSQMALASWLRD